MAKYLVETSHSPRHCVWALQTDRDEAKEMVSRFAWGCADGEHCGWAIVEAEHKFAAQALVPRVLRSGMRIVELREFTLEEAQAFHSGVLSASAHSR